jgi:hypothetical protein
VHFLPHARSVGSLTVSASDSTLIEHRRVWLEGRLPPPHLPVAAGSSHHPPPGKHDDRVVKPDMGSGERVQTSWGGERLNQQNPKNVGLARTACDDGVLGCDRAREQSWFNHFQHTRVWDAHYSV